MDHTPTSILIVDDHPVVRTGIRAVLVAHGFHVAAECASGSDALRLAAQNSFDAIVLDVNLPDLDGLEVTRCLRARGDQTPIVVLTVRNDSQTVMGLFEAGASGYVLKDEATDHLCDAVRAVARGETWVSPSIAATVIRRALGAGVDVPPHSPLTPRELDVLRLLAQGLDNGAIAQQLVMCKRTVQNHISIIYDKLGVSSRTEALLYAVQRDWVHLP